MGGSGMAGAESPHAALLIDFDNVTMGMRSDLSKELKSLLDSDVIKGKVSVQRAYADWRRYPQYIVPLSEASVDLIFAPAYGSNKKNATDIRMAIDGLELVFIRPEIGTYILLTGDSDFSSLVLKLKEYGKYVIGVGIQESSSDILVQNCDEYYSYTSLTGLKKTTELDRTGRDPWVLVKDAVAKMVRRGDVMRSDRLKQVMQELDPSFDEGGIGFSKFSKFLAEASSRGLIGLKKMENGQYEISAGQGRGGRRDEGRSRSRRGRGGRRDRSERTSSVRESEAAENASSDTADGGDSLSAAYDALRTALTDLREAGREPVRDSDVKRKMLEADSGFDETELGFPKFSRFLAQAEEHGAVSLVRTEAGNVDVSLAEGYSPPVATGTVDQAEEADEVDSDAPDASMDAGEERGDDVTETVAVEEPTVVEEKPADRGWFGLRFGRRGTTRRRGGEAPGLFEGQGVKATKTSGTSEPVSEPTTSPMESAPSESETPSRTAATSAAAVSEGAEPTARDGAAEGASSETAGDSVPEVPVSDLALPSESGAIARYLSHRYKGVGEKTAESLVEALGADLFRTMHEDPDAIAKIVPKNRAEQVLEAWRADYERRSASHRGQGSGASGSGSGGGRGRSRGRGRG